MARTKATSNGENYNAESIKTLEGTAAIRKRPGMYIGSVGEEGVLRLFYEALGNAIDEFQAKRADSILIKIDERNSEIQVSDNGIGIPQNKIEECCTKLHSSGKFEDDYSKFSIGQNGVGLTVINALSEQLTMISKRDGFVWKQTFSKGQVTSNLKKIEKLKDGDSTGTTVSFIPDITIFSSIEISVEKYMNFLELSSYMNSGLNIDFIGIDKKGKKTTRSFKSKKGLQDYITTFDKKLILKEPIVITGREEHDEIVKTKVNGKIKEIKTGKKVEMEAEVVIQYSKNDTNIIKSFCNGLETIEGGSHETGTRMALTEVLSKAVENSNVMDKKNKIEIQKEDITEGIIVLINVKHSNALFKSQTKDKLDMQEVQWFIKKIVVDGLNKYISNNSAQAKLVFQRIFIAAKARVAANRAKTAKKKEAGGLINGLSSLSKCTLASGDSSVKKRMFIVEGDSAGGGVVNARCTTTDSVMKLRGKPLNTHDVSTAKIEANKEFADLNTALGCGIDSMFDMSKLTHDQIIVMADSDVDGYHISVLVATFFFKHMPDIIKEGHFYIANVPLYKVEERGKALYFNNDEYNEYIANKILEMYKCGTFTVNSDGKKVLKAFNKRQLIDFLNDTKSYYDKILSVSSLDVVSPELVEFIVNNLNSKKFSERLTKKFPELTISKTKSGLRISGMIKDSYQDIIMDKKFTAKINNIIEYIKDYNYTNLFIKKNDEKSRKTTIVDMRQELLEYGTPKHKQRFKGLGEMNYEELWTTTMDPKSGNIVRLKANNMKELAKVFEVQMGNDADKRKIFLENFKITPEDIDN